MEIDNNIVLPEYNRISNPRTKGNARKCDRDAKSLNEVNSCGSANKVSQELTSVEWILVRIRWLGSYPNHLTIEQIRAELRSAYGDNYEAQHNRTIYNHE